MKAHTISENRGLVLSGKKSLKEIVEEYISNIKARNPEINAFISTRFEEALKQADRVQKKITDGTAGSLAGAVIGLKDVIAERGQPLTAASRMLQDFESVFDATIIEKLRQEDAIIIGRLNMDEFAMGSTSETSFFGPVKNPLNLQKVPGGSSGGSAAAVAANMVTASIGSDTGGSIRQPASYCGVVGLKPTYGRVSRHGLAAYASSFDSMGPITQNVEDAALMLKAISGLDKKDMTSSDAEIEDYPAVVKNPVKTIKIGVPGEYFREGLDAEIEKGVRGLLDRLAADGAELVPVNLPHLKYAISTYYILSAGEASSNFSRFDGIRYGYRADKAAVIEELKAEEDELTRRLDQANGEERAEIERQMAGRDSQLNRLYKKSRGEGFGPNVKRRILLGTYMLSAGQYQDYYVRAMKVRRLLQDDYKKAFEKVDVIATPTAPDTARGFGSTSKYDDQSYITDLFTNSANLAGLCAISVPAGIHSNGMPYGIQFMGDSFQESKILNAARLVELKTSEN